MKQRKLRHQAGFTLIELVIVVVLIGVLSAVAVPKYVDFKNDAAKAASTAVVGALKSASAINYAAHAINSSTKLISACKDSPSLLTNGVLPSENFAIAEFTPGSVAVAAVMEVKQADAVNAVTYLDASDVAATYTTQDTGSVATNDFVASGTLIKAAFRQDQRNASPAVAAITRVVGTAAVPAISPVCIVTNKNELTTDFASVKFTLVTN